MSAWLLSVAGIVVVGVLVEVLLTDSPTSKFVRSVFAFFVLFVIIEPLPKFLRDTAEAASGGVAYELNSELLLSINSQAAAAVERNCENALEVAGFENVIVTLEYQKGAVSFKISRVLVNAFGVVLRNSKNDIDISSEISKIVALVCGVGEDLVLVSLELAD